MLKNQKTGQGLPKELGKYMQLIKVHTSQEAPTSTSGSSSPDEMYKNLHNENEEWQMIFDICILAKYRKRGYAEKLLTK